MNTICHGLLLFWGWCVSEYQTEKSSTTLLIGISCPVYENCTRQVLDGWTKCLEDKLKKKPSRSGPCCNRITYICVYRLIVFWTGLKTLKERSLRRKLSVLHKIYNDTAPEFLRSITTPMRWENPYTIPNKNDLMLPNNRRQMTQKSFVHSKTLFDRKQNKICY